MSLSELIFALYGAMGVLVYAGLLIFFRKEGRREGGLTWGWKVVASFAILTELGPLLLALALLLWPLTLLGVLICWLDGKVVDESDDTEDKKG